jgi:endonuclease YncB( thermonuclease family)
MTQLACIRSEQVPIFSLENQVVEAKFVEIYDGDTGTIIFYLPGTSQLIKMKCRIQGVDSPEMRPLLSQPNRDEIKCKAVAARNRLCELVTGCSTWSPTCDNHNKTVMLKCGAFDKYGRLLVNDVDNKVALLLMEEGHCHAYDGKCTKPSW